VRRSRALSAAGWSVLAFLYLPVLVLAAFSFNGGRSGAAWESFSTVWYERLFDPSADRTAASLTAALGLSLRIAGLAGLLAVVLSALTAIGLRGARRAVALPLAALWALPILLPDIVLGLSWNGAFDAMGVRPGLLPIVLAHGTMAAAFALVVVRARLATLDPALVEAARDLGASPRRAVLSVVLPHLRPALLAAFLLAFTLSFDDFMVTLFLASPSATTMPVAVWGIVVRGASPLVNALATLSLVGTLLVAFLALRLVRPAAARASVRDRRR
jgi:spermidine/putrescine transport system permease protein